MSMKAATAAAAIAGIAAEARRQADLCKPAPRPARWSPTYDRVKADVLRDFASFIEQIEVENA